MNKNPHHHHHHDGIQINETANIITLFGSPGFSYVVLRCKMTAEGHGDLQVCPLAVMYVTKFGNFLRDFSRCQNNSILFSSMTNLW
jgi:hypothetical protein